MLVTETLQKHFGILILHSYLAFERERVMFLSAVYHKPHCCWATSTVSVHSWKADMEGMALISHQNICV